MSKVRLDDYGGALKWVFKELGGPIQEVDTLATVTQTTGVIVDGNPERVALVITNVIGVQDVLLALSPNLIPSGGIFLPQGGGFMILTLRDDLTLPSRRWYAACTAAGSTTLYIVQYIRVAQSILE